MRSITRTTSKGGARAGSFRAKSQASQQQVTSLCKRTPGIPLISCLRTKDLRESPRLPSTLPLTGPLPTPTPPSSTCLGPPAQAIVGTTSDTISLASVTLAPRKTSLWTSALSADRVALGCDRQVLMTADPSRPQMEAYVTGGKHGDGAVFALDLGEVSRDGRVELVALGGRGGLMSWADVGWC